MVYFFDLIWHFPVMTVPCGCSNEKPVNDNSVSWTLAYWLTRDIERKHPCPHSQQPDLNHMTWPPLAKTRENRHHSKTIVMAWSGMNFWKIIVGNINVFWSNSKCALFVFTLHIQTFKWQGGSCHNFSLSLD